MWRIDRRDLKRSKEAAVRRLARSLGICGWALKPMPRLIDQILVELNGPEPFRFNSPGWFSAEGLARLIVTDMTDEP
jgi:hypothetical protein